MRRAVVVVLVVVAAFAFFIGLHPVSPARTFDSYEHKAKDTAESVRSSVETARLAARLASRGRLYGPYSSVVLSEADGAIGGAQSVFESVQPPDGHADLLRDELGDLLSRSSDTVSQLRISARRSEISALESEAKPLDRLADELDAFIKAHD